MESHKMTIGHPFLPKGCKSGWMKLLPSVPTVEEN